MSGTRDASPIDRDGGAVRRVRRVRRLLTIRRVLRRCLPKSSMIMVVLVNLWGTAGTLILYAASTSKPEAGLPRLLADTKLRIVLYMLSFFGYTNLLTFLIVSWEDTPAGQLSFLIAFCLGFVVFKTMVSNELKDILLFGLPFAITAAADALILTQMLVVPLLLMRGDRGRPSTNEAEDEPSLSRRSRASSRSSFEWADELNLGILTTASDFERDRPRAASESGRNSPLAAPANKVLRRKSVDFSNP